MDAGERAAVQAEEACCRNGVVWQHLGFTAPVLAAVGGVLRSLPVVGLTGSYVSWTMLAQLPRRNR